MKLTNFYSSTMRLFPSTPTNLFIILLVPERGYRILQLARTFLWYWYWNELFRTFSIYLCGLLYLKGLLDTWNGYLKKIILINQAKKEEPKFSLGYMLISSKGIGRKKRINIVVVVISIESICYHSLRFSTYNYFG